QVERGSRCGRVRAEADAEARGAQLREWRDPAAEERVRAWAVHDRDVVSREQLDLLVVEVDAVRGDDAGREEPELGELGDRGGAAAFERAVPRARPAGLCLALGEVCRDRKAKADGLLPEL